MRCRCWDRRSTSTISRLTGQELQAEGHTLRADARVALRFAEAMGEQLNEAREMIATSSSATFGAASPHALLVLLARDRRSRGEAGDARRGVGFELADAPRYRLRELTAR